MEPLTTHFDIMDLTQSRNHFHDLSLTKQTLNYKAFMVAYSKKPE